MRFEGMGPLDVVVMAYGACELRPCSINDLNHISLGTTETPRMYCPSCLGHNSMKHMGKKKWHCRRCKCDVRKPLMLMGKGKLNAVETRVAKDSDFRKIDAFEIGRVLAAVESCSTAAYSWAIWAYTENGKERHSYELKVHLLDKMKAGGMKVIKTENVLTTMNVINAILNDHKFGSRKKRGCDKLGEIAHLDPSQFRGNRRWAKLKLSMLNHFQRLDFEIDKVVQPLTEYKEDKYFIRAEV